MSLSYRRNKCQRRRFLEQLEDRRVMAVDFTLQILHASDLEAGVAEIQDAPRFAAIVDALEDTHPSSITLSSGDNYIPGPFFNAGGDPSLNALLGSASVGRADIAVMNAIGFDASALGNHEFDAGVREVRNIIFPSGAWPGAQFPYLSANLDFTAEPDLNSRLSPTGQEAAAIKGRLAPSTVITEGTEKIGVIGVTTPLLRAISSPGPNIGISPADPDDLAALAAIVNDEVAALQALHPGLNKVILVSHLQQIQNEIDLAPLLSGVDVIFSGGSDTRLVDATDRLRVGDTAEGTYPIIESDADGNPVAILSTDGNYKYVGRLVVGFDALGILDPASIDPDISGAFAADDEGVADVWGELRPGEDPFAAGTRGAAVQVITQAVAAIINAKDGNLFGKTDVYLNGLRAEVRTEETNLGNLSSDANLWYAKAADPMVVLSLKNGGGIRDSIGSTDSDTGERLPTAANPAAGKQAGDVSQLDIENSLRFNNGLSLVTLTAAQLKQVAEHAVAAVAPGATPGQFPQIGGFRFSFDATRPAGSRVQSLVVVDDAGQIEDVVVDHGSLEGDSTRTFRMVTLNFLAGGGDNYPFPGFGDISRVDLLGSAAIPAGAATFAAVGSEQDALAEYMVSNFATTPFGEADTPKAEDTRLQNLALRDDTVIPAAYLLGETLFVRGTAEDNVILVDRSGSGRRTVIEATRDGAVLGEFSASLVQKVRVDAFAGDDFVVVTDRVEAVAWLFGGEDNDALVGGKRDSLLVGEDGNDLLLAGKGFDVLIGGLGNDLLVAQHGQDLLISGTTTYDADDDALAEIFLLWTGHGSYQQRINRLRPLLNVNTVLDDGAIDLLAGGQGQDWFWSSDDDWIVDLKRNEAVN